MVGFRKRNSLIFKSVSVHIKSPQNISKFVLLVQECLELMVEEDDLLLRVKLALFHLVIHFDELSVVIHEALLKQVAFEIIVVSVFVNV